MALQDGTGIPPLEAWWNGLDPDGLQPLDAPIPPPQRLGPMGPEPVPGAYAGPNGPAGGAPEIEMPEEFVGRPDPVVQLGFPSNPDEAPPAELGPPDAISGADPRTEPPPVAMQPGFGGIPAATFDSAAKVAIAENIAKGDEPLAGFGAFPAQPGTEDEAGGEIELEGTDFSSMSPEQKKLVDEERIAGLSEVELAQEVSDFEAAKKERAGAMMLQAAKAQREEAERAMQDATEARATAKAQRAQVEIEAKQLAETPPPTWHEAGGIGRSIAAFIAVVAGGMMQTKNGGRNVGFDMIEGAIKRHDAQERELYARKASALGDRRRNANEDLADVDAQERRTAAIAAATWESAVREIEIDQMNYDPKGSGYYRRELVKREAMSRQAKSLAEFEAREVKRLEELAKIRAEQEKLKLEAQKAEEAKRHNQAAEKASLISAKASQTSAGASYLNAKAGAKKTDAEIKALEAENKVESVDDLRKAYPNAPAEAFARGPMSIKAFAKHLETFSKGADVRRETAQGVVKEAEARLEGSGPGGSPYAINDPNVPGAAITNKNGKPVEIKDAAERTKAKAVVTAAKNVRRIADLVKIIRADTGGASSTVGSPEYQELQSLASQIDFETFVGYGLGAPSEGDKALAEGVRGGKDIASFIHDPSAGFEAYATGIEEKANEEMRKHGYDGPPLKIAKIEAAAALERTQQQNLDVWEPEDLKNPDAPIELKKDAARVAAEGVDTLARQSEPELLKILAQQNADRLAQGLIDPATAAKVQKTLRTQFRRKVEKIDPERAMDLGLGTMGERLAKKNLPRTDAEIEKEIDAIMLRGGGAE